MKSPQVSVIMATYNHEPYVKQAMDSVLAQKDVDFEFLIADDGSSDLTCEVIKNISDKRISFTEHKQNRGACAVTNELIQKSNGEYIALINSDDAWIGEDKLSYQLQIMNQRPELGGCFGRARFIDHNNQSLSGEFPYKTIFNQPNRTRGQWLRRFFDGGNCICHPSMFVRRSCFEELGLYNNLLRQLHDYDMWIRLVKKYDIFISERELVNFRILPGENTSSPTKANNIRMHNEHFLLIADTFFNDIDKELFLSGFFDMLINKHLPSDIHMDIEIVLLYLKPESPYQIIGMMKIAKLLQSEEASHILNAEYGINDLWFHKRMSLLNTVFPPQESIISLLFNKFKDLMRRQ